MRTELLPDAVWDGLDPRAARLDRRSRWMLLAAVAAAGVLAALAVIGQMSGVLNPRLTSAGGGGEATSNSHMVSKEVRLTNDGWFTEHIDAVDVTTPGFRLVSASGVGTTIAPHRTTSISVVVRVKDCSRVTRTTDFDIQLRLHRFWGEKTLSVGDRDWSTLPWHSCHAA